MAVYHHYKPLRNLTAKLDLQKSFTDIWQLFQNIERGLALPYSFSKANNGCASIAGIVHPWELDILAREVILNAGKIESKSLLDFNTFGTAINHIRKMPDIQTKDLDNTIFQEMHRIVQQQFPWQKNTNLAISRLLKIYRYPELEKFFTGGTGLSVNQFYFMGMALSGHLLKTPHFNANQKYSEFGVSEEQKYKFLSRVTLDINSLRERTRDVQEYNENWSYTINPLLKTPFVQIHPAHPNILTCPIPKHLMTRFSEGLFFDLAEIDGFGIPYGNAFENYIGDVSKILLTTEKAKIEKSIPYQVGKQEKHGVDWYVSDERSALLIECKTKGLKLKARYDINDKALNEELNVLAKSIVQNYKNLLDITQNLTNWHHGNRKLYPVTVTLSDWFLFAPKSFEELEKLVTAKLKELGLSTSLIKDHPYTVMSAQEYELLLQIVNTQGLSEIIRTKCSDEHKNWMTAALVTWKYGDEISQLKSDYLNSELKSLTSEYIELMADKTAP